VGWEKSTVIQTNKKKSATCQTIGQTKTFCYNPKQPSPAESKKKRKEKTLGPVFLGEGRPHPNSGGKTISLGHTAKGLTKKDWVRRKKSSDQYGKGAHHLKNKRGKKNLRVGGKMLACRKRPKNGGLKKHRLASVG